MPHWLRITQPNPPLADARFHCMLPHCTVHRSLITTNMQLTVAPESSVALTTDGTIRCLLDMRYPLPSRQSSAAIAFATQWVEELSRAIPTQLGIPLRPSPATSTDSVIKDTADAQPHGVLLHRNRIWVYFDLFHHDCEPEARQQADRSLARPIHAIIIHESGDGYRIRRSAGLDTRVAETYTYIWENDKGPRPYFTDDLNPPLYVDGNRVEGTLDEYYAGLDESGTGSTYLGEEGEDWELQEICGKRRAVDGVLELRVKWKSGGETWELYEDVANVEREAMDEYERLYGQGNVP